MLRTHVYRIISMLITHVYTIISMSLYHGDKYINNTHIYTINHSPYHTHLRLHIAWYQYDVPTSWCVRVCVCVPTSWSW